MVKLHDEISDKVKRTEKAKQSQNVPSDAFTGRSKKGLIPASLAGGLIPAYHCIGKTSYRCK